MTPLPLDIAVKATGVLGVAALVQFALRRRGSAAARHLVWAMAIAALLALPLASALVPPWPVAVPLRSESIVTSVAAPAPPVVTDREATPLPAAASPTPIQSAPSGRTRFEWAGAAVAIYACGLALLLFRLVFEQMTLSRLARTSRDINDPAWQRMLESGARELNVRAPIRLLQSRAGTMPLTYGTRHPIVILPDAADSWNDDRRRAVLLHELAHIARRDCLTQRLAALACAVYWPHPGVWWAARRLRIERELACDDRVLTTGTAAREYAVHLLEIAHSFRAAPAPATALGMARARQLESRLLAVLDAGRNRERLRRRGRLIAVAASIAVLPVAALRAVPANRVATTDPAPPHVVGLAAQSARTSAAADFPGTWEMRLTGNGNMVNLQMRTDHSSHGRTLPLSRFEGITASQIAGVTGNVHFTSRRDAGAFAFDGVCRAGACGGTFTFAPDPGFAAALRQRGLGTPTDAEQYTLALADIGVAFLDELKADGYSVTTVRELVRAADHGVDIEYVRTMAELGYRLGTIEPLVRLRDHGVDPTFVRGLADGGLSRLTADELVRARDHGVDPRYVGDLAALGYKGLSLDELVRARDHGVDPAYIRAMQGFGYQLPLPDLIRARDHGVDHAYVDGLTGLGYRNVPLTDLIRMRDHGVDPAYIRKLQQHGAGHPTVDELIRQRDHGGDDAPVAFPIAPASLWRSIVAWLRA